MTLYDWKTKGATDAFISRRREASLGLEISMDLITFIVAPVPFHLGLTFGEIEHLMAFTSHSQKYWSYVQYT